MPVIDNCFRRQQLKALYDNVVEGLLRENFANKLFDTYILYIMLLRPFIYGKIYT